MKSFKRELSITPARPVVSFLGMHPSFTHASNQRKSLADSSPYEERKIFNQSFKKLDITSLYRCYNTRLKSFDEYKAAVSIRAKILLEHLLMIQPIETRIRRDKIRRRKYNCRLSRLTFSRFLRKRLPRVNFNIVVSYVIRTYLFSLNDGYRKIVWLRNSCIIYMKGEEDNA